MMLVDDHGRVRVRDTEKAACRTAIAQDRDGRMLVLVTEGAVTLADLARYLAKSDLHIARAMNLDGRGRVAIGHQDARAGNDLLRPVRHRHQPAGIGRRSAHEPAGGHRDPAFRAGLPLEEREVGRCAGGS